MFFCTGLRAVVILPAHCCETCRNQGLPQEFQSAAVSSAAAGMSGAPAQAIQFMNELSVSLSAARQCFEGLKDTPPMGQMDEYSGWIMDSISTFLAKSDTMNKIECGAAIKHFQIESIIRYNILIKDIE